MKISKILWIVPLLGMLAMPAMADDDDNDGHYRYNRFEHRLDRQHGRIQHGIRNGELTRKEAKRLREQQRHIAKLERRFQRDGYLDRHERRTLRRELDHASQRIYRLKHNDRYRGRHLGKHRRYGHHDYYRGHHHKHYRNGHYDGYAGHGKLYDDSGWSILFSLWDQL